MLRRNRARAAVHRCLYLDRDVGGAVLLHPDIYGWERAGVGDLTDREVISDGDNRALRDSTYFGSWTITRRCFSDLPGAQRALSAPPGRLLHWVEPTMTVPLSTPKTIERDAQIRPLLFSPARNLFM